MKTMANNSADKATGTPRPVRGVIDERQHADQTYRLIDKDEEFYEHTGSQIIRACKMQINAQVWASNFRKTMEIVRAWAEKLRDRVAFVVVESRSDKVIFFVVPQSEEFDFDLGFAMADLDVTLNTQCNIGYAETRQVPGWDVSTFVSDQAHLLWPVKE